VEKRYRLGRGSPWKPRKRRRPSPNSASGSFRTPGLTDLSFRDYKAIVVRAGEQAVAHGITDLAAAVAYYSFLAIPAVLLFAVGLFSLFASPRR
jgi:hypothetical protein